jgi:hypothetical protein
LDTIVDSRDSNNWSERLVDEKIAVERTFIDEMGLNDCVLALEITKD